LEFALGEWLLSSYIATGMENVSMFIKADNAEEEIVVHLRNHAWAQMIAVNMGAEGASRIVGRL